MRWCTKTKIKLDIYANNFSSKGSTVIFDQSKFLSTVYLEIYRGKIDLFHLLYKLLKMVHTSKISGKTAQNLFLLFCHEILKNRILPLFLDGNTFCILITFINPI